MLFSILSHFCYGLVACFIGGLPLGIINMSVINITINKSSKAAYFFALGSSLVEIAEALIAIVFGLVIERHLRQSEPLQFLVFLAFVSLGIYFFVKKAKPINCTPVSTRKSSEFIKGVMIASLNPQAIPFWLFALAFVAPYHLIDLIGSNLYFFLGGVFAGKLLALHLFTISATFIKAHLNESSRFINRTMGGIFIAIGVFQGVKHIL